MTNLKRIYLLPEAEIADLYARPSLASTFLEKAMVILMWMR